MEVRLKLYLYYCHVTNFINRVIVIFETRGFWFCYTTPDETFLVKLDKTKCQIDNNGKGEIAKSSDH